MWHISVSLLARPSTSEPEILCNQSIELGLHYQRPVQRTIYHGK